MEDGRRGSALMTVLGLVFVVSMLLATVSVVGGQRSYMARKLSDRVRALAYAEAGANEAYHLIEQNWEARKNAANFPLKNYGIGTYDVTIRTNAANPKTAVIHSVGDCRGTTVDVVLDIKNYGTGGGGGSSFDASAFDYAILCGGTFTFRGCGNISSTNGPVRMHANGALSINGAAKTDVDISSTTSISIGNNKTVNGDVTAPVLTYTPSKVTITGTANRQAVPLVTIPDIDLTPYYNWANAHGEVKNGFSTSSSYTPNGGVLWVNGAVSISSWAVINGTVIATGNISVSGQVTVNPGPSGFALVSRDGNINNTSSQTINGLIYTKTGSYSQTANGMAVGQLVIKGDIDKGGNSDILVYKNYTPLPPDGNPPTGGADIVGISAWQK